MSRRISIDWKMVTGFGGLLFLIIAIGIMGILQIQGLSLRISHLTKISVPMQNAVLEMKSANSQYAMGIRSYMFWRGARYLDAAPLVERLNLVKSASQDFDRQLVSYAALVTNPAQKRWMESIKSSEAELRKIGQAIMNLIDQAPAQQAGIKKLPEELINKLLMDFENRLFQIDAFLDDPLQKSNHEEIQKQLADAEADRRRSDSLLAASLAIGLILGGNTALLIYRRSKRESERREALCRTVIKVEEEERNNLSLQVHDQMGQDLSALKIYLGLIDRDLPADIRDPREAIEKTKKILDMLMQKAHNISELLRPPELDELGLAESIGALVLQHKELTGAHFDYVKPQEDVKLSVEYSLLLYRIAQEALTNIAKYSGAKNVSVVLKEVSGDVNLIISDDGQGFDYDVYLKRPVRRKEDRMKLGLQGLRERVELLGGRLDVRTQPGAGTRLEVILPAG